MNKFILLRFELLLCPFIIKDVEREKAMERMINGWSDPLFSVKVSLLSICILLSFLWARFFFPSSLPKIVRRLWFRELYGKLCGILLHSNWIENCIFVQTWSCCELYNRNYYFIKPFPCNLKSPPSRSTPWSLKLSEKALWPFSLQAFILKFVLKYCILSLLGM